MRPGGRPLSGPRAGCGRRAPRALAGLLLFALAACAGQSGVGLPSDAAVDASYASAGRDLLWQDPARRAAVVSALSAPGRRNPFLDRRLKRALAAAPAAPGTDRALTASLLRWAAAKAPGAGTMTIADPLAAPLTPERLVAAAASASDPDALLAAVAQGHPFVRSLEAGLNTADAAERARLAANIARARALPALLPERHIVVDIAGARLWLFEGDRAVDSMKVVVGKPDQPTPLLASAVREIILRPYWNIPVDLAQGRIAHEVLKEGMGALKRQNLQVLSDWTETARPIDPRTVRWRDVAAGRREVRVRQRPGPANMMGGMKFMAPNDLGIYLHDTPLRADFDRDARTRSSGCVRLEDAKRLATWLMAGTPLPTRPRPEQTVTLPRPVPIWISYFTIAPDTLARQADPYGLDGPTGSGQRVASGSPTSTGSRPGSDSRSTAVSGASLATVSFTSRQP